MSSQVRIMNAVMWDDDRRLQRELAFFPTWHNNRKAVLRDALQLALSHEKGNAVKASPPLLLTLADAVWRCGQRGGGVRCRV